MVYQICINLYGKDLEITMKAVITDYQYDNVDQERALIEGAGHTLVARRTSAREEILADAADADAILTQYCPIDEAVISRLAHCRIIIKYGIGINNIDADAAARRGIYVCNVPDYGVDEVSNHAIALYFALSRKLFTLADALKSGDWGYSSAMPLHRVAGSTLGLVGFGRIPQAVAGKMRGFSVRLLAYDPFCAAERMADLGVEKADLPRLLGESDFISIHCPSTPETRHMFDARAFKAMKRSAFLINTARGDIVDEDALIAALEQKEIAGAGLDVFAHEPVSADSPLLRMPNVIATPHSAWYTEESVRALQRGVAEEVVRVLAGRPPLHLCNAALLQKYGFPCAPDFHRNPQ